MAFVRRRQSGIAIPQPAWTGFDRTWRVHPLGRGSRHRTCLAVVVHGDRGGPQFGGFARFCRELCPAVPCPCNARIVPGDPVKHGRVAKVAPPAAQPKKSDRLAACCRRPLGACSAARKSIPAGRFRARWSREPELSHDKAARRFRPRRHDGHWYGRDRPNSPCPCPSTALLPARLQRPAPLPDRFGPIRFEPETAEGRSHLTLALARQTQVELAYAMSTASVWRSCLGRSLPV